MPAPRIATLDGVAVRVVEVAQAPSFVPTKADVLHVTLELEDGEVIAAQLRAHREQFEQWAQAATQERQGQRPPPSPAEKLFGELTIEVADHSGTAYSWKGSAIGGSGTERIGVFKFICPGPDVHSVTITARPGESCVARRTAAGWVAEA